MTMSVYLSALSVTNLISRMPAAVAQGIIWGLMALGVQKGEKVAVWASRVWSTLLRISFRSME